MQLLQARFNIVGNLHDREVACSASDRQGSNCDTCVWGPVLSHSPHHPQDILLAQFSLDVHKGALKPIDFHLGYCKHISQCRSLLSKKRNKHNPGKLQTVLLQTKEHNSNHTNSEYDQ